MSMSKLLILENILTARDNKSVIFTGARIKKEREEKIEDFIFTINTNYINNSLSIYLYLFLTLHNNTMLHTNTSDKQLETRCSKKRDSCKISSHVTACMMLTTVT